MVKDEKEVCLAKVPCPYPSCDFITLEVEMAVGMRMLEMHERTILAVPVPVGNVHQPVRGKGKAPPAHGEGGLRDGGGLWLF